MFYTYNFRKNSSFDKYLSNKKFFHHIMSEKMAKNNKKLTIFENNIAETYGIIGILILKVSLFIQL
jgi:hypothetical protein